MVTPLERVVVESTHQDVERMLHQLAWNAWRRYGGELEEWEDAASLGYLLAFRGFNPDRGATFITWCWWSVIYCIRNHQTHRCGDRLRTNRLHGRMGEDDNVTGCQEKIPTRPRSFLDMIWEDLSEDARTIVQLVIDTPGELSRLLRIQAPHKQVAVENRKQWVRVRRKKILIDHLKKNGWSFGRVVNAFDEIKEVMT